MAIIPSINDVKRSRRLEEDNARIPRDMRKLAGSIIIPVIDNRSVLEKSIEFSVNSFSSLILPLDNALADIPELSAKESFASNGSIHEFAGGGTYASYRGAVAAKYGHLTTTWWGYPIRDTLNFSGVSTAANNVTLITPRHGVSNTHFGGGYDVYVGGIVNFKDHTTNETITGMIESKIGIGQDCSLVKFTDDITSRGDVKVYSLPLFLSEVPAYSFPMITQGGSAPFGLYQDRYSGLCTNNSISMQKIVKTGSDFNTGVGINVDVEVRYQDFQLVDPIFADSKFGLPQSSLAVGDSSSPAFIIYGNELLLYTTYLGGGGSGPGYGLSGFQENLKNGIETTGSEGYTISAVVLS